MFCLVCNKKGQVKNDKLFAFHNFLGMRDEKNQFKVKRDERPNHLEKKTEIFISKHIFFPFFHSFSISFSFSFVSHSWKKKISLCFALGLEEEEIFWTVKNFFLPFFIWRNRKLFFSKRNFVVRKCDIIVGLSFKISRQRMKKKFLVFSITKTTLKLIIVENFCVERVKNWSTGKFLKKTKAKNFYVNWTSLSREAIKATHSKSINHHKKKSVLLCSKYIFRFPSFFFCFILRATFLYFSFSFSKKLSSFWICFGVIYWLVFLSSHSCFSN